MLYKSRSLTLVTMIYSWYVYEYGFIGQVVVLLMLRIILDRWDICCEYNAGAQEVIFLLGIVVYETLCGHCVYWDRLYIGVVFG